jgi:hypothetical protein
MAVERFSFTMRPDLGAAVRRLAADEGVGASAWVEKAVAHRIRNKLLGEFLDEWQAEPGDDVLTPDPEHVFAMLEARGVHASVVAV